MKRAMVNQEKCHNCPECKVNAQCPQKAIIREESGDRPWVDFMLCRGCMKCKVFCANGAILEETKSCNGGFAKSW